jgi:hypothetical protein
MERAAQARFWSGNHCNMFGEQHGGYSTDMLRSTGKQTRVGLRPKDSFSCEFE